MDTSPILLKKLIVYSKINFYLLNNLDSISFETFLHHRSHDIFDFIILLTRLCMLFAFYGS